MSLENLSKVTVDKATYSLFDYENMFFGAIISGVTDGEELLGKSVDWFVQKDIRMVYNVVKRCKEQSGYTDYIAIHSELVKDLGSQGTKEILFKLTNSVPSEYNPTTASQKLEQFYIQRQANNLLEVIKEQIQHTPYNASDLFLSASEKLDLLFNNKVDFSLTDEFQKTIDGLNDGTSEKLVIPTGLEFFDGVIGGFSTQEVTIIGARPGHGKTSSVVQFSLSILDTNPTKRVCIFQLEMSKESVKRKFLSNIAKVSSVSMRLNTLTTAEKGRLTDSITTLQKYNDRLFIFDDIYDLTNMNKIAKSIKADIVFVDFITLMDEMKSDDTRRELGRVAIRAKRFAKTHNMSYVFYSQLNRTVEARDTKRPEQGDIAESDILTQLASEIILLSYRYKYTRDPSQINTLMVHFDKARYSTVGDKRAWFDGDLCIIKDYPVLAKK